MSFARFMDLALNHPLHGYYARGPERLGRAGDFVTASDVGPSFGACIARQLVEIDRRLGRPETFHYVEPGAGRGMLAADVARTLAGEAPGLANRLRLHLVDRSPGMRAEAAARLPDAVVAAELPGAIGSGCVVAVELFDALPVHRVRRRGATLREVKVALSGDDLVEIEDAPGEAVAAEASACGAAPDDGDEAEICPARKETLESLARSVDRGVVLIVDYGHEAATLYGPRHRRGTLMAYHAHRAHEDYLTRAGEQDLTAHVNLTALRADAEALGLAFAGLTTQDRFLIASGILEGLDAGSGNAAADAVRRSQVKQLVHPHGMGTIFKVAAFSKGVAPPPDLPGFRDPFA